MPQRTKRKKLASPNLDKDTASTPIKDKENQPPPTPDTPAVTPDNKKNFLMRIRTRPIHQDLKTAVLVKPSMIPTPVRATFSELFLEKVSEISTNRPVQTPDDKFSTPKTLYTPGDTELHLKNNLDGIAFYDNDSKAPGASPITKQLNFTSTLTDALKDEEHPFFQSKPFESIRKPEGTEKHQSHVITKKGFDKVQKKNKENNYKRCRTQAQVMVEPGVNAKNASATQMMKATGLAKKNQRSEWGHLIMFGLQGNPAQNPYNMVSISNFTNTDMMFIEYCIKYITTHYPEGYDLDVKATVIERTQIGIEIHYNLKTPDFNLALKFPGYNLDKPYITCQDYMRALVEGLVEAFKSPPAISMPKQDSRAHTIFKPKKTDTVETSTIVKHDLTR